MAKTKTKKQSDASKEAKKLAKQAEGTVHLAFLLDESGSMADLVEQVVSGYNEFLDTFRNSGGDIFTWLGMFDKHPGVPRVRIKHNGQAIDDVKDLRPKDYNPRGMTPLNDAVIETIEAMDAAVGKDERAFVVILTDGYENASEHTAADVKKVIKKREKAGWAFLYLGANQNAQVAAQAIGLTPESALHFNSTPSGTKGSFLRTTDRAAMYLASPSKAEYDVQASADSASTGGEVEDAEDEA